MTHGTHRNVYGAIRYYDQMQRSSYQSNCMVTKSERKAPPVSVCESEMCPVLRAYRDKQ